MALTWPEDSAVPGDQVDEDGRRGGRLRPDGEVALLGDHEVHLGRLDPLNGVDGLLELALESLLVLDLLDELRGGDAALLQIGEPDIAGLGRPCSARATRSWSTSAAGTRTVEPPSASWYGIFWLANCCVMAPESEDWRLVKRGW